MSLEPWDEVRTALFVARAGTVSGAAAGLGVHHATVIRHVDALEDRLGVKLFQRHAKGYTQTEAGRALAQVAGTTEEKFAQLAAQLQGLGGGVEGDLVITTVPDLFTLLMPTIAALMQSHPGLRPRLRTDTRVLRLEYGEAHVALRAGTEPREPDNVVQPLGRMPMALYASPVYLEAHGTPADPEGLRDHGFIGPDDDQPKAPFDRWLMAEGLRMTLRSQDREVQRAAIEAGLGIGFLPVATAGPDLRKVLGPRDDWSAPIWLVTHVDLHRSPKVKAAAQALKEGLAQILDPMAED